MDINPDQVQADGNAKAEVVVWVFQPDDTRTPFEGLIIEVCSSRRDVDVIEQPAGPTNAEGKAVAYISSSTIGEARLRARAGGLDICAKIIGNKCEPTLEGTVTFNPPQ